MPHSMLWEYIYTTMHEDLQ